MSWYERNDHRCFVCGIADRVILHHRSYERLLDPRDEDLVALCEEHHAEAHDYVDADVHDPGRLWWAHETVRATWLKRLQEQELQRASQEEVHRRRLSERNTAQSEERQVRALKHQQRFEDVVKALMLLRARDDLSLDEMRRQQALREEFARLKHYPAG